MRLPTSRAGSGVLSICLVLVMFGCGDTSATPYWKVLSIDAQRHFVLVYTNEARHEQTEYTLECRYFKWGNRETVSGPDACSINVGQVIVPHVDASHPAEFVDVDAKNDWLTITMGDGDDRVMQGFRVISARLSTQK
jgi:hypothetical protein